MLPGIRLITALFFISVMSLAPAHSQAGSMPVNETLKAAAKPFRILTSGKSVTVKSTKDIRSIMVWTAGGHRIIEEKDINTNTYNFRITVNAKILYIMVQLADGKTYSEKIGVQ